MGAWMEAAHSDLSWQNCLHACFETSRACFQGVGAVLELWRLLFVIPLWCLFSNLVRWYLRRVFAVFCRSFKMYEKWKKKDLEVHFDAKMGRTGRILARSKRILEKSQNLSIELIKNSLFFWVLKTTYKIVQMIQKRRSFPYNETICPFFSAKWLFAVTIIYTEAVDNKLLTCQVTKFTKMVNLTRKNEKNKIKW